MFKKLLFISILFLTYISILSLTKHPPLIPAKPALKTIIIDPGHGGKDPGAHGLFSNEAQVSLQVSLLLGKAIQKEFPDVKIVYTRTTDVLPGNAPNKDQGLRIRANMANEARGDLFVSVHCNAAGLRPGGWNARRLVGTRPKVVYIGKGKRRKKKTIREPIYESYYVENKTSGTETFIWAADRSTAKSTVISAEETGEDVEDSLNILDLNSPEARIRAQLYTKFYFRNSYTFAKFVEDEFQKSGRVYRGGVKQRNNKGIWVLQATGMPSVLIEIGFITNKQEEEYLNSENGQQEIVGNIMDALKKYKQELESSPKQNTPAATVSSSATK
ncbi:MAG: N-acetylmuramoyl-L-alanine amidase [Chitinophagaceae bacterium]